MIACSTVFGSESKVYLQMREQTEKYNSYLIVERKFPIFHSSIFKRATDQIIDVLIDNHINMSLETNELLDLVAQTDSVANRPRSDELVVDLHAVDPTYESIPENDPEDFWRRKKRVTVRLKLLEHDNTIAQFNAFDSGVRHVHSANRNNRGGYQKNILTEYDSYIRWAKRKKYELKPQFEEGNQILTADGSYLRVPALYAVARRGNSIQGVFPCFKNGRKFTIEHYITSLEAGEDWERLGAYETKSDVLETRPYGPHGHIKTTLLEHADELIGPEWSHFNDEYLLQGERDGYIDLIFRHDNSLKYLIVEVKPSGEPQKIDRAFGQLLRYKHLFLENAPHPDITEENVMLAIAAPDFHNFHDAAAADVGIKTIRTS